MAQAHTPTRGRICVHSCVEFIVDCSRFRIHTFSLFITIYISLIATPMASFINKGGVSKSALCTLLASSASRRVLIINICATVDVIARLPTIVEPTVVLLDSRKGLDVVHSLTKTFNNGTSVPSNMIVVDVANEVKDVYVAMMVGMFQMVDSLHDIVIIDRDMWRLSVYTPAFAEKYLKLQASHASPTKLREAMDAALLENTVGHLLGLYGKATVLSTFAQYEECFPRHVEPDIL